MTCDAAGNIYAAIRNESAFGMAVYSPTGKRSPPPDARVADELLLRLRGR